MSRVIKELHSRKKFRRIPQIMAKNRKGREFQGRDQHSVKDGRGKALREQLLLSGEKNGNEHREKSLGTKGNYGGNGEIGGG